MRRLQQTTSGDELTLARMLVDVGDAVLDRFGHDEPDEADAVQLWSPMPGPQVAAIECQADELFFGGGGGGGKTDLLIGAALTGHRSAIIFRREFAQFGGPLGILERTRAIVGLNGRYSSADRMWRGLPGGRALEFGAVQHEDSKNDYKGRAHDFKGYDEITEFTETQYRFLNVWLRTADIGQRTRVIATGNPPTTPEGQWVIRYWAPWLDPHHRRPAKPGELRWFAVLDGQDVEVDGPDPIVHEGREIRPRSRSFIPARVEDNPYYVRTGYVDVLDNLPEPLRSQMRFGDFQKAQSDHAWQIVPTAWIVAAQKRWTADPPAGVPLTAIGCDPSRGGADEFAIAKRYAQWIAPLVVHQGREMPDGPTGAAALQRAIVAELARPGVGVALVPGDVPVQIDIIGSAGSSVYDQAKILGLRAFGLNGSETSDALDRSGRLTFVNKRAEWHWRVREALDPTSGQDVALPPDPQLLSDLCAPRWRITPRGIQVEAKADIVARIGRSPDRGEAVIYAIANEAHAGASATKAPDPGATTHLERLRALAGTMRRTHRPPGPEPAPSGPAAPAPELPPPPSRPRRRFRG